MNMLKVFENHFFGGVKKSTYSQRKICCVVCPNASKKRLVAYRMFALGPRVGHVDQCEHFALPIQHVTI